MAANLISLLYLSIFLNLALVKSDYEKLGEYQFEIQELPQNVEIFVSEEITEEFLKILQNDEKSRVSKEVEIIESSCLESSFFPSESETFSISLHLSFTSESSRNLKICRVPNQIILFGKLTRQDFDSFEDFLDSLEDFSQRSKFRRPFKTQVFIDDEGNMKKKTILKNSLYGSKCLKFRESKDLIDLRRCEICQVGYFVDTEDFETCKKCEKNCRFCKGPEMCNERQSMNHDRKLKERSLECSCTTLSCYRKLDGNDICQDCDSQFCKFCDENVDYGPFNYIPEERICISEVAYDCFSYCLECSDRCIRCEPGRMLLSDGYCGPCTSCSACYSNCLECSDEFYDCLSCKSGFFLQNKVCVACESSCLNCFDNCKVCNSSSCLICLSGYAVVSGKCEPCYGCTECFGKCKSCTFDICSECEPGYYFDFGKCQPCTNSCSKCFKNCLTCNDTLCLSCVKGYFLSNTGCSPCTSSCSNCFSNCLYCTLDSCTQCNSSYYLVSGVCLNCTINCQACFQKCDSCTSNKCLSCLNGYYLSSNKCMECTSSCDQCFPNCLKCSNIACTSCKAYYYINSGKCEECKSSCSFCFPQCETCTNANCLSCVSGYYLNGPYCSKCSSHCLSCFPNCNACTNTACISCFSGYFLTTGKCFECSSNCKWCFTNCNTCTNLQCTFCDKDYYLSRGGCLECSLSCSECFNNCEKCTKSMCLDCLPGYYLNDKNCLECPKNCIKCMGSICELCHPGYLLINGLCNDCNNFCNKCYDNCEKCSDNLCRECLTGYYLDFGKCNECSNNCEKCFKGCKTCDNTKCLSCMIGFFIEEDSCEPCEISCSVCYPKCLECDSLGCITCETSYFIIEKSCVECSKNCSMCFDKCFKCSNSNCSECLPGYFLNETSCLDCNSHFKNCIECNKENCLKCIPGYYLFPENSQCFNQLTIHMKFFPNYLKIKVIFSIEIELKLEEIITENIQTLFGKDYKWVRMTESEYHLHLGSNYHPDLYKQSININCEKLTEKGIYCKDLKVMIQLNEEPFPSPVAVITGPDELQESCDLDVQFSGIASTGDLKNKLLFKWINDDNGILVSYESLISMKSSKIIEKFKGSDNENLRIRLNVTNIYLKESSVLKTIKIKNTSNFYLGFGSIDKFTCFFDQVCIFFIPNFVSCVKTIPKFEWYSLEYFPPRLLSSPHLIIKDRMYQPREKPYIFNLKILNDSGSTLFEYQISVYILKRKPRPIIGRCSGSVWANEDLILDGSSSFNPNSKETSDLKFEWKVKDQDNSSLFSQSGPILKLTEMFLNNSTSLFTSLTVCESEDLCSTIEGRFLMSENPVPKVTINNFFTNQPVSRVSQIKPTKFKADIEGNDFLIKSLEWTLNENSKILSIEKFINFDPKGLLLGKTHFLKLSIKTQYETSFFTTSFSINKPPEQGTFEISPKNGTEIETVFNFVAIGWIDEENDYPLIYEFAYQSENQKVSLITQQQSMYATPLSILGEELAGVLIVYDLLGDYSVKNLDIQVQPSSLDSENIYKKITEKIIMIQDIPSSIFNLFQTVVFSQSSDENLKKKCFNFGKDKIYEFIDKSMVDEKLTRSCTQVLDIITKQPSFFRKDRKLDDLPQYEITEENSENYLEIVKIINILLDSVKDIGLTTLDAENLLNVIDQALYIRDYSKLPKGVEMLFKTIQIIQKINILVFSRSNETKEFQMNSENIFIEFKVVDKLVNSYHFGSENNTFSVNFDEISSIFYKTNGTFIVSSFYFRMESPEDNNLVSFSFYDVKKNEFAKLKSNSEILEVTIMKENDESDSNCFYIDKEEFIWTSKSCSIKNISSSSLSCTCSTSILSSEVILSYQNEISSSKDDFYYYSKSAFYTSISLNIFFISLIMICSLLDKKSYTLINDEEHSEKQPYKNESIQRHQVMRDDFKIEYVSNPTINHPSKEIDIVPKDYSGMNQSNTVLEIPHNYCEFKLFLYNFTILKIFLEMENMEFISRVKRFLKLLIKLMAGMMIIPLYVQYIMSEDYKENEIHPLIIFEALILSFCSSILEQFIVSIYIAIKKFHKTSSKYFHICYLLCCLSFNIYFSFELKKQRSFYCSIILLLFIILEFSLIPLIKGYLKYFILEKFKKFLQRLKIRFSQNRINIDHQDIDLNH